MIKSLLRLQSHFVVAGLITILSSSLLMGQEVDTVISLPGIEITTSVDRAEVYIGDLIEYSVSITYDSTYELVPPPLGANLGAFDVKDYEPDIETKLPDGRINSKTIFKLSTFTTGDYVIPAVPVFFRLPDKSARLLLAEPVPIKVISLLLNVGDSADIRPLKQPYEFKRDYSAYYWWGAGLFLVVAALLFFWFRYRRSRTAGEQIDLREPWEIAFEKLALLGEKNLPAEDRFKQHYIELSDIWREYLGRMYHAEVLEMTTEEILERFAVIELPPEVYNDMTPFLTHADLVKFARYTPECERIESDLSIVHDLVEAVRADHERRKAAEIELRNRPIAANVSARENSS